MAAVYVEAAFGRSVPALAVRDRHADRWDGVLHLARSGGTTAPRTSSAGRLFDAVSALLGVRDAVTYEGQAAIELEQAADPAETGAYASSALEGEDGRFEIRGAELVRRAAEDLRLGEDVPRIAARFHNGVAHAIRLGARLVRTRSGLNTVALSGGVFQNALLLERAGALLEEDGFEVLRHREVPSNDGGVSLGQAVIAGSPAERNPLTSLLRPLETPSEP
jgi:hydrogenase maturation protein HypF